MVYRRSFFGTLAQKTAHVVGHPGAFCLAVLGVLVWAMTGPLFHFSDTWQLVINTSTTILTFLVVFLLQNTQNRDTAALQLKVDELIRVTVGAHNALLDLEELHEEEILAIRKKYKSLAEGARKSLEVGGKDTDTPELGD